MNGKIIALVALLFMASLVQAESLFYTGDMAIKLNKEVFLPGDELKATITLSNVESIPIADAYIVVDLVAGKDYYYPSQTSDADNIFAEKKITGINIEGGGKVSKEFTYTLPANLAGGDYRIDAYAKTGRTHIIGVPHIFASPEMKQFRVRSGESNEFPQANIVRTKTKFHEFLGPIGPGIDPGANIENEVFVKNTSSRELKNLSLFVGLCEWDDTYCESFESEDTKTIASLKAGEEKAVSVSLKAGAIPDAYAIRLELRNSEGELLSFYRNRSVVYGETAKIHKLNVNDYMFKQDDTVKISVLVGASPDHYRWPTFENFTLKAWVEDLESGAVVGSGERVLKSIYGAEQLKVNFEFPTSNALNLFKVCASIEKQNVEHENYCYTVDASLFPPKKEGSELEAVWTYDYTERKLDITFSNKESGIQNIDAAFLLMNLSRNGLAGQGVLQGTTPIAASVKTEPSNFLLIVNNFAIGKQQKFDIVLDSSAIATSPKNCAELGGTICTASKLCENPLRQEEEGICCASKCIEPIETKALPTLPKDLSDILLIMGAVLVIIILVYNVYRKKTKEPSLGDFNA